MPIPAHALLMAAGVSGPPTFNDIAGALAPDFWWKSNDASGDPVNYGSGSITSDLMSGNPTYQQAIGDRVGIDYDGTGDFFSADVDGGTNTDPLSFFAICRADSLTAANYMVLFHTGASGTSMFNSGLLIAINGSNGFLVTSLALSSGTRTNVQEASTGAITTSQEFTVGAIYNGSTLKGYIDGAEVDSTAYSSGGVRADARVASQRGNSASALTWNGVIADVMVWDGTAIDPSDLVDLHNASGV
jgi:hypothetical protein